MPTSVIHRIGIAASAEKIYCAYHRERHPRVVDASTAGTSDLNGIPTSFLPVSVWNDSLFGVFWQNSGLHGRFPDTKNLFSGVKHAF